MLRRTRSTTPAFSKALAAYERARPASDTTSVCNAPFTNLYLRADGAVAPCWLQFTADSPVWSPDGPSITEMWRGDSMRELRDRLLAREFDGPCQTCRGAIATGNLPLAAAYDQLPVDGEMPTMLELELSNQCNLECVMCSGMLSSRIRANREQLPPLEIPYDERLVDQVCELLPHLHELRINGGEPLMQPLVHQLLDRVASLAPELKVTIATNGTVLNSKVERAMQGCNLHFNVSIDSLVPERYEEIRVHARFDVLMRNVEHLIEDSHRTDRLLCIMVNPMRQNWGEMPDFVEWCDDHDVALWFNTVRYPDEVAMHTLPAEELRRIRSVLLDRPVRSRAVGRQWLHDRNRAVLERFRDVQLPAWIEEAAQRDDGTAGQPVTLTRRPGSTR